VLDARRRAALSSRVSEQFLGRLKCFRASHTGRFAFYRGVLGHVIRVAQTGLTKPAQALQDAIPDLRRVVDSAEHGNMRGLSLVPF
jgi:hypothetical protein